MALIIVLKKPLKGDEELHTHTNSSSIDNNSNM